MITLDSQRHYRGGCDYCGHSKPAEGDARGSGEFRAVLVEELGHRARGAAGDLAEGAGRVVVLTGQDRPLA